MQRLRGKPGFIIVLKDIDEEEVNKLKNQFFSDERVAALMIGFDLEFSSSYTLNGVDIIFVRKRYLRSRSVVEDKCDVVYEDENIYL